MKQLEAKMPFWGKGGSERTMFTAAVILGCGAGSLMAGCGAKDTATTVPVKAQAPAPGAGVGRDIGNVKLTPSQSAARQRAIQQEPAFQETLKRAQEQQTK